MFVLDDVAAGADIALTLAQRTSELNGRPELHVGLAYGPVLRHLGDYYGTVVNLANRLASLARPGTVLIDHRTAELLREDLLFEARCLNPVTLRGFLNFKPWLLTRAGVD